MASSLTEHVSAFSFTFQPVRSLPLNSEVQPLSVPCRVVHAISRKQASVLIWRLCYLNGSGKRKRREGARPDMSRSLRASPDVSPPACFGGPVLTTLKAAE